MKIYQAPKKILQNYADVLINFALNSGEGVKKGEVVQCAVPDIAKDFALELQNTLLRAGAYPMLKILPTGFDKDFYSLANEDQLKFFPKKYVQERVNLIDHSIGIIADPFPFELKDTEPKKIVLARDSKKKYREWLNDKEAKGKFTWTLGLWAVEAKAEIVGLSMKEYWQQIINACFLDKKNPVAEWKKIAKLQKDILKKLNKMEIEYLIIKGKDIDMKITLGKTRIWQGGSGRNIPSFELFTSPDWRGVEGWVQFNQPVYRYGNIIEDAYLKIEKGIVTKSRAKKGDRLLKEMLRSKNANKIGEYSLTDKRMSRITHVMAETLYDENIGGPYGNTHMAIGMAYKDCYRGDQSKPSKKDWEAMGFNIDSAEHTDIVSTTDRTATAFFSDGSSRIIYQDGKFVI
ncbi:MAG: aminopeptidase [Patescibacteria group bacterium]